MKDFFISFSKADRGKAAWIAWQLRRAGYSVVFQDWDFGAGSQFIREIHEALIETERMIGVLSPDYLRSRWCTEEWTRAYCRDLDGKKRTLIPVRVRPCEPSGLLAGLDFIDLVEKGEEEAREALVSRIAATLRRAAGDQALPDAPPPWDGAAGEARSSEHAVTLRHSTAAFVGFAERGPPHPVVVRRWEEYARWFGDVQEPESNGYLACAVKGFFENGGERAIVIRAKKRGASCARAVVPTLGPARLAIEALNEGAWGDRVAVWVRRGSRTGVRVTIAMAREQPLPALLATPPRAVAGAWTVVEDYDDRVLSGPGNDLLEIDGVSSLVRLRWDPGLSPAGLEDFAAFLAGGKEGIASVTELIGDPDVPPAERRGLAAPWDQDEPVGLLCVPDAADPRATAEERATVTRRILERCRAGCFAILAGPPGASPAEAAAPGDAAAGAAYWPWVCVPHPRSPFSTMLVPPVGHVAGAFARSDATAGVHRDPVLLELDGLAAAPQPVAHVLSDDEADAVVRRGVNPIRVDVRTGRAVLATARTMAIADREKPIRKRRFAQFVECSVERGLAWVRTADPTDETARVVRGQLTDFFMELWRAGALLGDTAEEAFFVRCDVDGEGLLNVRVGYALSDAELSIPRFEAYPTAGWQH